MRAIRVPYGCHQFCRHGCDGGHFVEVAYFGASDTATVRKENGERAIYGLGEWVAMMQAAALVSQTRRELDDVKPEALAELLANPDSVNAEYRDRNTGELLEP